MTQKSTEMQVIVCTKDLCSYVLTVTQQSPKNFRYTFVTRMQNLALDAVSDLYRANDTFVAKDDSDAKTVRM